MSIPQLSSSVFKIVSYNPPSYASNILEFASKLFQLIEIPPKSLIAKTATVLKVTVARGLQIVSAFSRIVKVDVSGLIGNVGNHLDLSNLSLLCYICYYNLSVLALLGSLSV